MNKRLYILGLLLIGLSLAYGLYYYDQLPDPMAVHLSFDNTPDRWQGKLSTIWGLPVFFAAIETLMFFSARQSPQVHPMMQAISLLAVPVIGLVITMMMVQFNLGADFSVRRGVLLLLGGLFLAIGNYLPKTPPNDFYGYRFPWTGRSPVVWAKTQRLGGYLFIGAGFLALLAGITDMPALMVLALIGIFVAAILPVVYAWRLDRQLS
ncbi:SdpI family protein [Peptococcus simiae]|uniref:SdpI family protein n=1 Tax=Peptococcus simiae TaxID=1643805 RepID=A0ABW9GYF6_9FIRM